jgi:hypothetical protein
MSAFVAVSVADRDRPVSPLPNRPGLPVARDWFDPFLLLVAAVLVHLNQPLIFMS